MAVQVMKAYPVNSEKRPNVRAAVEFAYEPGLAPVPVVRTYKGDNGKWNRVDLGEVMGASVIRVRSAVIMVTDGGAEFLQCDGFEVPAAIKSEALLQAKAILAERV